MGIMWQAIQLLLEIGFLVTFWWQSRINLRQWWPDFFSAPLTSDYLIPFVYLSDIFLIALLVVVFMRGLWRRRGEGSRFDLKSSTLPHFRQLLVHPLGWFGILVGASFISVMLAAGEWWSWYGWWRLVEGVGLAWYVSVRLRGGWWQIYAVLLMWGLAGEAVLMVVEWMKQGSVGLQWIGEWRYSVHTPGIAKIIFDGQEYVRSYGTFAHPNIAGGVLAMALTGLCGWYWSGWRLVEWSPVDRERFAGLGEVWRKIVVFTNTPWVVRGVGVALGMGLMVTFSRSAWLVAVMGVAGMWLVTHRQIKSEGWLKVEWRKVGVILMLVAWVAPMVVSRFASLGSTDALSYDRRVQLMEVAQELLMDHVWWGVGLNNFVPQLAQYGPLYGVGVWREPVHNLFVLLWVEGGIGVLLAWIVGVAMIGWQSWRQYAGEGSLGWWLLLMWWGQIIMLGLVDHYWWTNQQGRLVLWLMVGAAWAMASRKLSIDYQRPS